jgi:hypothetical protein
VVADKPGTYYDIPMQAGYVYTIAGTGTAGYSGDGGPAVAAELSSPYSAAADGAGNVLLADGPRIRVIAAKTGVFYGVPMTSGRIYTIAGDGATAYSGDGGPATAAGMAPAGVALDNAGNVLISDAGNARVRVLPVRSGALYGQQMTAGDIYTIAGNGSPGPATLGRPATSVPIGGGNLQAATDAAGNVVLSGQYHVFVVAVKTGTFYGQKMTAGDIYSIAGNSSYSVIFGDGGPATKAYLNVVTGVTVTPAGNVLIPDARNFRIRSIAR